MVLDVQVRDRPARRPRGRRAVRGRSPPRACACAARRRARERRSRASCSAPTSWYVRPTSRSATSYPRLAHTVDERPAARRHEQHVVAARAKRVARTAARRAVRRRRLRRSRAARPSRAANRDELGRVGDRVALDRDAVQRDVRHGGRARDALRTRGARPADGDAGRARRAGAACGGARSRSGAGRTARRSRTTTRAALRSSSASNSRSWNGLSGRTVGSSARGVERTRRPPGFSTRASSATKRSRVRDVLDDLERADDVEGVVGERELEHVGDEELDVRPRVVRARVRDRVVGDVHADHALGDLREVGGPVADAATCVEHACAATVRQRELVALEMQCDDARLGLVRDDPLRMAHRSLTASKYPDGRFDGRLPPAHTRARRPGDDCRNDPRVRSRIRVDPLLARGLRASCAGRPCSCSLRCPSRSRSGAAGRPPTLGVRDRRRRLRRARSALGALVAEADAQRRPCGPLRARARDVRRAGVGGVGATRHGVARRRRCAARPRARRARWPRPARGGVRPRGDACDDRVRGALPGARRRAEHGDDGDGARRPARGAAAACVGSGGRASARACCCSCCSGRSSRPARAARCSPRSEASRSSRCSRRALRGGRRSRWAASQLRCSSRSPSCARPTRCRPERRPPSCRRSPATARRAPSRRRATSSTPTSCSGWRTTSDTRGSALPTRDAGRERCSTRAGVRRRGRARSGSSPSGRSPATGSGSRTRSSSTGTSTSTRRYPRTRTSACSLQLGAAGILALVTVFVLLFATGASAFRGLDDRARLLLAACAGAVVGGLVLAGFQSFLYAIGSNAALTFWLAAFMVAAAAATRERATAR